MAGTLQVGQAFPTASFHLEESLSPLWQDMPEPGVVWISNVAEPKVADALVTWLRNRWNCPVRYARSESYASGVHNGYIEPEKLGVDRWMALIAVRQMFSQPACVVGCGTALTVDVIDTHGQHLGGFISPGLGLMADTLTRSAEGLKKVTIPSSSFPLESISEFPEFLGRATDTGIAGGCLLSCLGLIEQVYSRVMEAYPGRSVLVLTGGDAEILAENLRISCRVEPNLVLQGLFIRSAATVKTIDTE